MEAVLSCKLYMVVPSPVGHGWHIQDNELIPHWMGQEPAPKAVMEVISCHCKADCSTKRCSCRKAKLPSTPACTCTDRCTNTVTADPNEDEHDEM